MLRKKENKRQKTKMANPQTNHCAFKRNLSPIYLHLR